MLEETPETVEGFNHLVDSINMTDKTLERSIWYQDETKDWILISDDDDLQLAYETAQHYFEGHLNVFINKPDQKSPPFSKKNNIAEKQPSEIEESFFMVEKTTDLSSKNDNLMV